MRLTHILPRYLSLTTMDMQCVPIARLEFTVGLLALPISKNNIKEVKPVKKLKQSEIRIRRRRI